MMMRRLPRLRLFSVGVRCQATAKVLEGGWEQWADDDGTPYYHHRATGKTQWHYPLQQDAKPRPPAPEFRRYEEPAKFGRRYEEPAKFGRRDDLWERKPQSNAYGDWEDLAAVELRSEVNSELNFCPNFEGLVLGYIDADFCK